MNKLLSSTALIVTLAFSGAALAHECDHGKDGDPKGHHHGMHAALAKLPEKDAAQFRDTLKQAREKDKPLFEQMGKLHKELHDILTADKFDKDAFSAKNKELSDLHDKMHGDMSDAMATALSQLPQDERKTLADAMQHEHHGKWHHHDGDKKPDSADKAPVDKPAADTTKPE